MQLPDKNLSNSETCPSGNETASKKEKFDLCREMLKGYYDALESRIEKTVALLLVLVGWLITSDTARKSMKDDPALFWSAIVTLTLLIGFLTVNLRHFLGKLLSIKQQAIELDYVCPKYFSRYSEMNKWHLLVYLAPVLIFYIFIIVLLFQIKFNFLGLPQQK